MGFTHQSDVEYTIDQYNNSYYHLLLLFDGKSRSRDSVAHTNHVYKLCWIYALLIVYLEIMAVQLSPLAEN